MLPEDQADMLCEVLTREKECARVCMKPVDERKRQKMAKQDQERLALAKQGERVEVYVLQKGDWYEGRLHENPSPRPGADASLLSVKFVHGAILENVQLEDLLPRLLRLPP